MKNFLALLLVLLPFLGWSQGCSDAGFCTMGAMKPDQDYNKKIDFKLRSIEINAYYGQSTLTPVIKVLTADANISLSSKTFFQVKIPYQTVTGSFGETSGLGDISLSISRILKSNQKGTISATLGTKIPTNDSDLNDPSSEFSSADLPMYYQVSLGSFDLIAGAAWVNEKWLIATGIQVALTRNENEFKWGDWFPEYPDDDYVRKYDRATHLKRGTDIMLRVERNFRFTNFNFNIGLLPIYRITQDERSTVDLSAREKVDDTTGLALSVLVGAGYNFNINSGIKMIFGHKLTDRKVNPDGLTRDYVLSFSYVYRF